MAEQAHPALSLPGDIEINSWIIDSVSRRVKKKKKKPPATSHEEDATLPRALGDN